MFFRGERKSWQITLLIGLSLSCYAWYQWNNLSVPSDADFNTTVEIRYQEEIAKLQERAGTTPMSISQEWQDKFRTAIRAELQRPFEDQKRVVYGYLALGLITLVIGLGSFVAQKLEKTDE